MIESISIINHFNSSCEYLLKVYTNEIISGMLSKIFYSEWKKTIFLSKRRVEVEHNEIRIFLRKGDIIQKYIDYVPKVLSQSESYLKLMQEKKGTKKRQVILKRDFHVKSYSELKYLCPKIYIQSM